MKNYFKVKIMSEIERANLKNYLNNLLDSILEHQGYGEIKLDIKWAKQGHKEVIITAGKQFRFIVPVEKKSKE
jgi:hypothetical protein